MKKNIMNMTEGNPVKLLIVFSLPMLLGNLFQQVYNLVDSIIVGRYVGANALAAIGATSSVGFLFFALSNGVGNGGGIITSQLFGAGEDERVKNAMANTAYLMLIMAAGISVLSYVLSGPVLRLLQTPAEIYDDALLYMHMTCIGVPLIAVYNYASSMLRALGDSKGPLYFLIFSCILNIGLDILFVRGLNLSVFGAALATIIAQLIAGLGCLTYALKMNPYFRMTKENLHWNNDMIWRSVRLGVPLSIQFSLIAISCMGLQVVVNGFGPVAIAAFTAVGRVEQVVHQPYQSLGAALSTYSGQNMGAKKHDRIIDGFRKSLLLMVLFTIIIFPIMQFCGKQIMSIFVEDMDVIEMGAKAMQITSYFYVTLGVIYISRGVLNGLGDAVFALINGLVEVITRITIPVFLTAIPTIGIWGVWWATGLVWAIAAATCIIRYFSWKKKHLYTYQAGSTL